MKSERAAAAEMRNPRGKAAAFAAFVLSMVLAFAAPATAWAADTVASPQGTTATGDNGVSLTVNADLGDFDGAGGIQVAAHGQAASNVPAVLPEGHRLLASFRVSTWGDLAMDQVGNVTLTFNVGRQYAGATAYVYIQHETEPQTTEVRTVTVMRDGTVSITVDRLSVFTIVVDESTIGAAFVGTDEESVEYVNDSAISPQTGVSAGMTLGASLVAGCCAVAVAAVAQRARG